MQEGKLVEPSTWKISREYKKKGSFMSTDWRWKAFLERQEQRRTVPIEAMHTAALTALASSNGSTAIQKSPFTDILSEKRQTAVEKRQNKTQKAEDVVYTSRVVKKLSKSLPLSAASEDTLRSFTGLHTDFFASQLVIPEYMCQIPADISQMWLCYMRPEGPRALLCCLNGQALIYSKNGNMLKQFPCGLPRGAVTILEIVLVKDEDVSVGKGLRDLAAFDKIHAVDVLCWHGCTMSTASAECRFWFLSSRFSECKEDVSSVTQKNHFVLDVASFYEVTPDNLLEIYYKKYEFVTDSMSFVHKEALYLPGVNPLYMCWKDKHISRWLVDNPHGTYNSISTKQVSVLLLRRSDGVLLTADKYIVYRFDQKVVEELFNKRGEDRRQRQIVRRNSCAIMLLRVSANDIDINLGQLVDVEVLGLPSVLRRTPDTLSRILYQHYVRHPELFERLIGFEAILKVARDGDCSRPINSETPHHSNCFEEFQRLPSCEEEDSADEERHEMEHYSTQMLT